MTEDGGKNWRKIEKFPGVADMAYVSRIITSNHDANTAYVAFENHQNNDFKPYLLKTTDAGRTWTSLSSNLPKNHPVWSIAEDHVNPNLLFTGTEFGLLLLDRWRTEMDSTERRSAYDPGARSHHSETRERSGCRHFWTRHLHSRQLHATAFH